MNWLWKRIRTGINVEYTDTVEYARNVIRPLSPK